MAWTTPKTNWRTGELVTAQDMNAVGENFAALKQPATAVGVVTEEITQSGATTFSDVDSDNLNLTISTVGGDVLVHFHGTVSRSIWKVYFDVEVDGIRQGGDDGILQTDIWVHNARAHDVVSFTRLIRNLSAGSHTFKLQWKGRGHGLPRLLPHAQFWVREIS